ncbi:MAG: gamma-glutamyltransferase [Candidatus Omnitrophica bacterium]|nr:gamma-glutamyltransferase [Candidatus Omnitrophota bacterium]
MNRRSFLQTGGASAATAVLGLDAEASLAAAAPRPTSGDWRSDLNYLDDRNQNRSTVIGAHGMVCTSQPLATLAGIEILKSGGSAVDAAICANAMLGLVEPMSCGPGGDLFSILWMEKDKKLHGLNAGGRAPKRWSLEEAQRLGLTEIPGESPLAWNVPGCVSGWGALHERFGKLPFARVLEPAIRYAAEGFPVSPIIAGGWPFNAEKHPTLAKVFMPAGQFPKCGDLFRNPDLAEFYKILARDGAGAYYQGEIAERLVKFSEEVGGYFSLEDFKTHTVTWVEPVNTTYRGYEVWEIPPNGQGISVLQILKLLEHFDIRALEPNSVEHLHLFIEAKKLAYEDRAVYYADPAFAEVPTEWLISKEYAAERVRLIDPKRAADRVLPGNPKGSDTVYLTAADGEGNMVSLIQSNYAGWGSHIVPTGLGFPIQNRGESFALDPSHRNRLAPGKRPFHTIIPAFMTREGKPVFSFGVMGGNFQPQGHSQVVMNLVDFGFGPQEAGEQPRVEHSGSSTQTGGKMVGGGKVQLERHIPDSVREGLVALGHMVREGTGSFGGYQGIWREEDPLRYFGGSDPRKDGCALGF